MVVSPAPATYRSAAVGDTHSEDGSIRRRHVGEPLEVGFAERPLPRERLAAHRPCPVGVPLALGDLGQRQGDPGNVVDGDHARTVPPSQGLDIAPAAGR